MTRQVGVLERPIKMQSVSVQQETGQVAPVARYHMHEPHAPELANKGWSRAMNVVTVVLLNTLQGKSYVDAKLVPYAHAPFRLAPGCCP